MKPKEISASIKAILVGAAFSLMGCDQVSLPHVWGPNEVPPEVVAAPTPLDMPPPAERQTGQWMRLGDIPSRPKDFPTPSDINAAKQGMEEDRTDAAIARERLEPPPNQVPQQTDSTP
jgi:hypothetical protein